MRRFFRAPAVGAVLLLLSSRASADEPNPEALQHFMQGRRLLDAGRCPDARAELRASIAIEPSIGAYYNLGLCSEKVAEPSDAFMAYSAALALAKERHDEREREIRAQLSEFLDRTPHVRLVFTQPIPAGTRIAVDGVALPTGDVGPETRIFPKAGVSVVVTAPGYVQRQITVQPSTAARHEVIPIDLARVGEAPAESAPSATKAEPRAIQTDKPESELRWYHGVEIGAAVIGAVALGYAVVAGLDYDATERRLRKRHGEINPDAERCDPSTAACLALRSERNGLESQYDDNEGRVPIWIGAGVGGAVLLGAGLALFLVSPPWSHRSSTAAAVTIAPTFRSEGGGLMLIGRF